MKHSLFYKHLLKYVKFTPNTIKLNGNYKLALSVNKGIRL